MLNISNISIHFGGKYLFDGVSLSINKNDRIGLIGRNGTGKTTLLKIITGLEMPEEGIVSKPNEYSIGYLPQEVKVDSSKTVFEEAKMALSDIINLEATINNITNEISNRTDYESTEYNNLIKKLTDSNDRLKLLGGHSIEADIEEVLIGLGFERTDFTRSLTEFSGGWKMRVELAKILLRHPDSILLDEPTNHLDIESIQWLENFLKNYDGSILVVSHDRKFLDSVTNRTVELSLGKIYDFKLPYSQFIEQRDELLKQQMSAYKSQQKQIAETERFIERFRSKSTLATRVQSRIKQLEKIERIEVDEIDTSAMKFRFPEPPRSGILVAEANHLSKRYGEKLILHNIDFAIERGEKVAFVGKNGEGKTTFSKVIAGLEDYDGELKIGYNVQIGYYAQHQAEMLDGNSTVFEVIDNAATGDMRTQVRSLLGAFLFGGESINKKVKILSGGEKSRLAIAKLLLEPVNLLIMDEPTNHLDMLSKDVLKKALQSYAGALIIVSHDRDFLNGLTQKTYHFKNKAIQEFPGSIYEFLDKMKLESLQMLEVSTKFNSINKELNDNQNASKVAREAQKQVQRELNKTKKQIAKCEEEIQFIENEISSIETEFSDPTFFDNVDKARERQDYYQKLRQKLDNKMNEWTELSEIVN